MFALLLRYEMAVLISEPELISGVTWCFVLFFFLKKENLVK